MDYSTGADPQGGATPPTTTPQYRPGDVANGHVLGSDNQWHPLAASTSAIPTANSDQPVSAAQKGHNAGDSLESKNRKMILWGAGGIAGIVLLGVLVAAAGSTDTASSGAAAEAASPSAPSAEAAAEPAPVVEPIEEAAPGLPAAQAEFIAIVETARANIDAASTDLQEKEALRQRDQDLANLLGPDLTVRDWVGTITDVGAGGDGATVEIEIADSIRVTTWNNAFSDIGDNTTIAVDSELYNALLTVEKGDQVVFSGSLFPGRDTALRGTNLTDLFYGIDPKFLFRFDAIAAA